MSPRDKAPYFEIRKSKIQGRGAFATRRIRAGTRIIEYTGELVTQDEANRRYEDDAMGRHHTFLFAVDDDRVIDGAVGGNESRFINHSCAPNCQAVNEDGRIFVEALTTIEPGTELLYDYAYARTPDNDNAESEGLYACRCGAPTCRGSILEPRRKTPARRKSAAKRATVAKRGAAKRATSKRTTTERVTAKRTTAKRERPKRSAAKAPTKGAAGKSATKSAKRGRATTAGR